MRRPARSTALAVSTPLLMDEPRDHVAVRPRHFYLSAGIEHQEAFAIGMRLDLPDEIEVDDGRAMDTLETARVEPLFQILHGLAQDQGVVPGLDAHVIASGINPFDRVDIYPENLALVLDVDHLFVAVG